MTRPLTVAAAVAVAAAVGVGLGWLTQDDAPGYSRAEFGQRWADVDRNGCGQRDDVLARDLTDVQRSGRCTVVYGVLADPYTGVVVVYERGDGKVHIDHVVPLAEAWESGASEWTRAQRQEFANDLGNLLATTARANQSKGADDPAEWLPPATEYRCPYVRQWVAVKDEYGLSSDRAEQAAIDHVLRGCP